jgi:hypothetical protein
VNLEHYIFGIDCISSDAYGENVKRIRNLGTVLSPERYFGPPVTRCLISGLSDFHVGSVSAVQNVFTVQSGSRVFHEALECWLSFVIIVCSSHCFTGLTFPARINQSYVRTYILCRSRWPRGQVVGLGLLITGIIGSDPARGMVVCLCVCVVLSYVGRGLCDGMITRPKSSYQVS